MSTRCRILALLRVLLPLREYKCRIRSAVVERRMVHQGRISISLSTIDSRLDQLLDYFFVVSHSIRPFGITRP
jgi:hypothetical protein